METMDLWWTFYFCMIWELLKDRLKSVLFLTMFYKWPGAGGQGMTLVTIEPYTSQIHSNFTLQASHNASRNPKIEKLSFFLFPFLELFGNIHSLELGCQSYSPCSIAVLTPQNKSLFTAEQENSSPVLTSSLVCAGQTSSVFGTSCDNYHLPNSLVCIIW